MFYCFYSLNVFCNFFTMSFKALSLYFLKISLATSSKTAHPKKRAWCEISFNFNHTLHIQEKIPQRRRSFTLPCFVWVCESDSFWWDFTQVREDVVRKEGRKWRKEEETWIYACSFLKHASREIIKNYFSQRRKMKMEVEICERKMKYISDISLRKLLRFRSHLIDWQVLELENYLWGNVTGMGK